MKIFRSAKPASVSFARRLYGIPAIMAWIIPFLLILPKAYPQQKGVVEGRLINRTNPSIVASGVDLDVIALSGGMSIIKTATTDSSGKFHIEGLDANEPLMIRANYKSANYHGRVSFDASGRAYLEIDVFEPTASMKGIQTNAVRMAFQLSGNQLTCLENVSFDNRTKPPKTYVSPEGSFRFSKPPGILDPPKIEVTAPGSSMPLIQSALESPDGQSYYSAYPLRPGITTFEARQVMPYENRSYTFVKKFYQDIDTLEIGVTPQDMVLSGQGLSKIRTDPQNNFAVYRSIPVQAGLEVIWTFSGGTAVTEPAASETAADINVRKVPNGVSQYALVVGPLLLIGFMSVLWFAFNRMQRSSPKGMDISTHQLKERREQLLNHIAGLDHQYETHSLSRQKYVRQREEGKRRLGRISQLLKSNRQ